MNYIYNKIEFFLNGQPRQATLPPGITTLKYLHDILHLYGSKCSCNEGDCGACTVVIASAREGAIVYEAVNSCLYPAARLHGKHLITIEGLGSPDQLHPIQQAMLDFHATQCGYCSPGFVMSAFAMFASNPAPDREEIMAALEGNLCRCTGYDSIYKSMLALAESKPPVVPDWARDVEPRLFSFEQKPAYEPTESASHHCCKAYLIPGDLQSLWSDIFKNPEHRIICGGTDIMVQSNIGRVKFPVLIDLTRISELRRIFLRPDGIHIGANVTYSDVMASGIVKASLPVFGDLIRLIASRQIRNSASIVGNIGNASPIGDSLPLLLVLDCILVLSSAKGERRVPISEYFISYKKTALAPGEIISQIIIPNPPRDCFLKIKKAAKRKNVDISSISSALRIELDAGGKISRAMIAFGGAAEIPKLSSAFGPLVQGKAPKDLDPENLGQQLAKEFEPISDVRGSAGYRRKLIIGQVVSCITELQGRPI